MYRAEVEPMCNDDRIPRSGLWKVVTYEGERFAERHAEELNYQFTGRRKGKGA